MSIHIPGGQRQPCMVPRRDLPCLVKCSSATPSVGIVCILLYGLICGLVWEEYWDDSTCKKIKQHRKKTENYTHLNKIVIGTTACAIFFNNVGNEFHITDSIYGRFFGAGRACIDFLSYLSNVWEGTISRQRVTQSHRSSISFPWR